MRRTLPRRLPEGPSTDYRTRCGICGVVWMRSAMRRDTAGRLTCPHEGAGRDEVELSRANAAAAATAATRLMRTRPPAGAPDENTRTALSRTTYADVLKPG